MNRDALQPAASDEGQDEFLAQVHAGLARRRRSIPPKFFYDATGSALFERICETPEYYPTRTEAGILAAGGEEMAALLGTACALLEFGCGSAVKTPALLRHFDDGALYVPIDICRPQLDASALRIAELHPGIRVRAVCGDYTELTHVPGAREHGGRRVIFFPGSTIGNHTPSQARRLLQHAARLTGPDGAMLVGVDCKKDHGLLNAAYNDAAGVTAAFNLNLLARMQRELGAAVERDGFAHYAFYNPLRSRVEMHLVSRRDQVIDLPGAGYRIGAGESIHTENSYKYAPAEFQDLARSAGWTADKYWTDADGLFAVHYLCRPRLVAQQRPRLAPALAQAADGV